MLCIGNSCSSVHRDMVITCVFELSNRNASYGNTEHCCIFIGLRSSFVQHTVRRNHEYFKSEHYYTKYGRLLISVSNIRERTTKAMDYPEV